MSFFNGLIIAREQAFGTQIGAVAPPIPPVVTIVTPSGAARRRRKIPRWYPAVASYLEMKLNT